MSTHNSLTAQWDIKEDSVVVGSQYGASSTLSENEVKLAKEELLDDELISKFKKQEKYYADPLYNNQTYCLHSFVPTAGATPDKEGVYGFMKCRGTFFSQEESDTRAEWLIRNVDSYHAIQTAYVGRPFPVCKDSRKYTKETNSVDIRKKAVDTVSKDLKSKREEEQRDIKDIKEREKHLIESTGEDAKEDPQDQYTTLQVKRANLVWTYVETRKKMDQMKESILKTRREIAEMDKEDSSYRDDYYEHYMKARREAGLPTDPDPSENNFIKYMAMDAEEELGF